MGNSVSNEIKPIEIPNPTANAGEVEVKKSKCKACCACPETKKIRDEW